MSPTCGHIGNLDTENGDEWAELVVVFCVVLEQHAHTVVVFGEQNDYFVEKYHSDVNLKRVHE